MIAAAALVAAVFYFSWIPDPSMARLDWMPPAVGRWADRFPTLRTGMPFVPLGGIVGVWLCHHRSGWRHGIIAWAGLTGIVTLAELGQLALPLRVFDLEDIFWGATGAGLGLSTIPLSRWVRRKWTSRVDLPKIRTLETRPRAMKENQQTRLDRFDSSVGLVRGKSACFEALWYLTKCVFFLSPLPWPAKWKCALLRGFGATVGEGVNIKPRVNIHFPWKLELGDHVWLGEEVFILNFEQVKIGAHSCVSQRAFLCGGNHDFRDPAFSYRNAPITLGPGVWIGAQAFVGPGVEIGDESVVAAGAVVTRSVPPNRIHRGNPATDCGARWKEGNGTGGERGRPAQGRQDCTDNPNSTTEALG